jgi:hypothetical protein
MKNHLFYCALISFAILTSCGKDDFKGKACFTYSPESGIKVGDVVTFTNCSKDAAYFMWNLGDKTTSAEKAPTHSYTEPGTYTISLVVQDDEIIDLNVDMSINELDRLPDNSDIITATIVVVANNE